MARQVGPVFATGTIDGIIFYKLGEHYYMRSKGDYKSGKQMRKDPRLKRTMEKADQFRTAVKLLKPLYYRYLPKAVRKYGLFGKLTGLVNIWLQAGKNVAEVKELLVAHLQTLAAPSGKTIAPKVNVQPAVTPVVKPATRVKQARYLSNWKVKRNGRLHIPKHLPTDCMPPVMTLTCHLSALGGSGSDLYLESVYKEKNE